MIKKISIVNFKAIKDCLNLPLQPFTAFIGNNGSGKSSVMEGYWAAKFRQVKTRKI